MDSDQGDLKERLGAVLQAMKDSRRPGMDLLSGDDSVLALCGCILRRQDGSRSVAFSYCSAHAAGPELLTAVRGLHDAERREYGEILPCGKGQFCPTCSIIAKASQ